MKKTATSVLVFLLISFGVQAQTITYLDPDTGIAGQTLTVSLYAQNTQFIQGSNALFVSFIQATPATLPLQSINVISDTVLNGTLKIPSWVGIGYSDVVLYLNGKDTLASGFYIDTNPLVGTITVADATCDNAADGSASISVLGCSGIYTYLWNDANAQTTATATGLTAGNYYVTVTDSTGCNIIVGATVNDPFGIVAYPFIITSDTLGNCVGTAGAPTVAGGTMPYSYLWNDPMAQTTFIATGLCAGSHTLIITDNNGCTKSILFDVISVDGPASIQANPNAGFAGQSLSVSLYGQNTHFTQANQTPLAWFTQSSPTTLSLTSVSVINDTLLTGILNIPSGTSTGFSDVFVYTDFIDTATQTNGFYITHLNDSVWPGDANADGIANNFDLFPLGLGSGTSGAVRAGASLNWVAQSATDWIDTLGSGVNYKHVDCNGDGTIDDSDTLAIVQNYGYTHNKTPIIANATATDPALFLDINIDTISTGGQLNVSVMLGTSSIPASNVYGLAFSINYDPNLIDPGSVKMNFINSWIGNLGTDLISLQYDSYIDGKIDVALVRTDQTEAAGFGQISELTLNTASSLSGGPTSTENLLLSISDLSVIMSDENPIVTNVIDDSLVIEDVQTGLDYYSAQNNSITIYPNPNSGRFEINRNHIGLDGDMNVSVYQITGTKVLELKMTENQLQIDLTQMDKGIYYIQAVNANAITTKRVIVQ